MGLCKTSNFSIFTFINGSYLTFCPHSYSSCAYLIDEVKSSNGKVYKMMKAQTPSSDTACLADLIG